MNRPLRLSRLAWFVIVLLTSVSVAEMGLPTPTSAATSGHGHSSPVALGVYAGPANIAGVRSFGTNVGNHVQYAMDFINGSSWQTIADPSIGQSVWQNQGYSMIWGVPMLPNRGASLTTGATGAYNKYFASLAQTLVADGQGSSILRVGWEFNGIWFPWAAPGHAKQYVQYWRQIITTMRSVPGAHFKFEWNPSRGDNGSGNLANYYPGNAYVDYTGLDVFDVEWQSYPGEPAEFQQMETEPYGLDWLASFSAQHHKPMTFPEWGLGWGACAGGAPVTGSAAVCGGDNAVFINDMSHWFATHNVLEATYWDFGSSSLTGKRNHLVKAALHRDWSPPARHVAKSRVSPHKGG